VLVAIQGDQSKPGIITYHDLGLNRKNIYIVNYYRYFWTNQSINFSRKTTDLQTRLTLYKMFPRRIKVEKLGKLYVRKGKEEGIKFILYHLVT